MATSKFIKILRDINGVIHSGAKLYVVPQANTYPTGALILTESASKPGYYSRDALADGEYKIYLDSEGTGVLDDTVLYEEHVWHGELRQTTIANRFNSSAELQTAGIADNAVTTNKIVNNSISDVKIINDSIGTLKLVNAAVTPVKMAAQTATVTSLTSPAPSYIGQKGRSAGGLMYTAIALTGTCWELDLGGATPLSVKSVTDHFDSGDSYKLKSSGIKGAAIINSKLFSQAVTIDKISFVKYSKNLFNKSDITSGYYVSNVNGTNTANKSYSAANTYIPVSPSTDYFANKLTRMAFYDIDQVYISGLYISASTGGLMATPANCYYIRVSLLTVDIDDYQVEVGGSATSYVDYSATLNYVDLTDAQLNAKIIEGSLHPVFQIDLYGASTINMFDVDSITTGYYVDWTDGVLDANVGFDASDFMTVKPSMDYKSNFTIRHYAFYDLNKVFISGASSSVTDLTTPSNAYYLRVSFTPTSSPVHSLKQIEEGTTVSTFEKYVKSSVLHEKQVLIRHLNDVLYGNTSNNLFNYAAITEGHFVDSVHGDLDVNATYDASDYVKVTPSTDYVSNFSIVHHAFYDNDKKYISGANGIVTNITTPANCYYIRFSIFASESHTGKQYELGTSATIFESYTEGFKLSDRQVKKKHLDLSIAADPVAPRIIMPDEYVAVVGTKLQIFYRGIIEAKNPMNYFIQIDCAKGKDFIRYFEYTPVIGDVGDVSFKVSLFNDSAVEVATKTINIKVVSQVGDPASTTNILTVGDSFNNGALDWGSVLAKQVYSGTNLMTGLTAISNIEFVGELGTSPEQYTGYGGWEFEEYNSEPDATTSNVWVYCTHDKDASDQESIWIDSNSKTWQLETIETNRLEFKHYGTNVSEVMPASGILTHSSAATHTTDITYTSTQVADSNPFWDSVGGDVDFHNWFATKYPTKESGGEVIDACFIMLGWNGLVMNAPLAADQETFIVKARTFLDNLHTDYPSCKVYIMGVQVPSVNGGLGTSYGASADYYSDYYTLLRSVMGLNLAYQDLCNEAAYSGFTEFINISGQFDSDYNMQDTVTAVNTRNSTTELIGTNGIHPADEGYLQIADAALRWLIKDFCQ
jgi:lysophospholipase L1-like esterase